LKFLSTILINFLFFALIYISFVALQNVESLKMKLIKCFHVIIAYSVFKEKTVLLRLSSSFQSSKI
jgi:hypothetical protein